MEQTEQGRGRDKMTTEAKSSAGNADGKMTEVATESTAKPSPAEGAAASTLPLPPPRTVVIPPPLQLDK